MRPRFLLALLGVTAAALAASPAGAQSARSAAPSRGEALYDQLCSACHGRYGRGDGPVAAELSMPPPDFTRPELLAGRSDEQVVASLLERSDGAPHTPMVVARALDPEALREAVAFARTLAVPGRHVSVRAGRDLYETFCWTCHGLEGNGKGPAAANVPGAKPRDFTAPGFVVAGREKEVAATVTRGAAASFHGSEYMLEWGTKLSPQQISDIVQYLATFQSRR
jgi:mono/diheme cytochrome c family protein